MVEANEAKRKIMVLGSSTSLNFLSKASIAESSLPSKGESNSASVALPPKKRNRSSTNILYGDQNEVQAIEEQSQINENVFPLKKRTSLYGDYVRGEQVHGRVIQDARYAIKDNMEDKVGEEIINEMEVYLVEAGEEEEEQKKDRGIQVSNPISLIAIAASWLADAEAIAEKVVEDKPTLPQAFARIDESDEGVLSEELDLYSDNNNGDGEGYGVEQNQIVNESVTEKIEIKRFTKPRSSIPRRPKTDFTVKFNGITVFAVLLIGDRHAGKGNEQVGEVDGEDITIDDLYSTVKKRRQRGGMSKAAAKDGGQSRSTRMNGKGWRCSNQTTGGFAFCEHHLGRQEILRRMGDLHAPGKMKGKPKYRSMKAIIDQTRIIEKW